MRILDVVIAAVLSISVAFSVGNAAESTPEVAIGWIEPQTGRAELDERLLQRQFADGGPIQHLVAVRFDDGYNLLRIGKDAQGSCRTEAIRLNRTDFRLKLQAVRWFTTCSSSTCAGANDDGDPNSAGFAMCSPNHDKTGCDCIGESGESSCNFGIDVGGMGLATVLVQ